MATTKFDSVNEGKGAFEVKGAIVDKIDESVLVCIIEGTGVGCEVGDRSSSSEGAKVILCDGDFAVGCNDVDTDPIALYPRAWSDDEIMDGTFE